MADAKRIMATGAAMAVFAAGGAVPAQAAVRAREAGAIRSMFSGTIEVVSADGLLVERKQRKGESKLIAVETDRNTIVSRGGLALSVDHLTSGAEVIVSGVRASDDSVRASKIVVRS